MKTMNSKTGPVDGRVEAGDILEIREKGRPTEHLRVTAVKGADVTIAVIGQAASKPETWEVSDLAGMAHYSARSAESLAPRRVRTLTMTDAEHEAVKALLAGMRKAAK